MSCVPPPIRCLWFAAGLAPALCLATPTRAIDVQDPTGLPPPGNAPSAGAPWPLDKIDEARAALARKGLQLQLIYYGEALGNPTGGIRQGSVYEGRLGLLVDTDLEKLMGWNGATFHASIHEIEGHGLSTNYLDNLFTATEIEARPTVRLFNLWIEQQFADGLVSVRAGQISAQIAPTHEFFVSQFGNLFVNATFGWPAILASNLPSGGPTYPLAAPGVRVKVSPTDQLTFLAAIFDGDPAGPGAGDPQLRDPTGTNFRVNDPALVMAEADYAFNHGADAASLPGTVKLGGWYHFGQFADQRLSANGLSLADPRSLGAARQDSGDYGIYGIIDQMLWRVPGTPDQGLGAFARVSTSPADRNLISAYFDGGLTYRGLFPGRENDRLGVGFAYADISSSARALDQDTVLYSGVDRPIRDFEAMVEVTYRAQITRNWYLQPMFQYIIHPGGHIPNPLSTDASAVISNAAVVGLKTVIRY